MPYVSDLVELCVSRRSFDLVTATSGMHDDFAAKVRGGQARVHGKGDLIHM